MTNEEAIKTLKAIIHIIPNEYYNEETEGAIHMAIKALEQEPCDDAISRQAAHEAVYSANGLAGAMKNIDSLPSATPMQRTGHWIKGKYRDTCSECRYTTKADRVMGDIVYDFCPFCGVKMIGREEQE